MLIDVHAHFFPEKGPRADWREYNASRLHAGETIGITIHLTSILGTYIPTDIATRAAKPRERPGTTS